MAVCITSKIDIDEREKGFKDALDLLINEKLSEQCIKGLYNGVYKSLLFIFLADIEKRKQKILEEFKEKKSLDEREWNYLYERIKEI